MSRIRGGFSICFASLSLLASPAILYAQTDDSFDEDEFGLDDIVVTAQKRSEPLQTTPVAVTAIDQADIVRFDIIDPSDIDQLVPSLTITSAPTSKSSLLMGIRGVGVDDAQITLAPAVGTYIDGVYAGQTLGLNAEIVDLHRIEVLRGPQGTLYGRNTTGGAINLISSKPTAFGGELRLSAGDYGYRRGHLRVDSGEHSGFAARLALSDSQVDGWRDNDTPGASSDFGADDREAMRIALVFSGVEDLELLYAFDKSKQTGPQQYYQLTAHDADDAIAAWTDQYALLGLLDPEVPGRIAADWSKQFAAQASDKRQDEGQLQDDIDDTRTKVSGHNFTASYRASDYLTVKSITGVRSLDEDLQISLQGGVVGPFSDPYLVDFVTTYPSLNSQSLFITLTDTVEQEHDQVSQEFQFIGANEADTLQYVLGLYYYQEEAEEDSNNPLYSRRAEVDNETAAVFGQASYTPEWDVTDDRFAITVGARYTTDRREIEKDFRPAPYHPLLNPVPDTITETVTDSERYNNFSPNLMLSYQLSDDVFSYAKVMTGYKSGGYNVRSTVEGIKTPYDEETLIGYELGLKSEWFDKRLRTNIALYYNDYDDMHVTQIPNESTPWETNTINAAEANIQGVEVDLAAQLLKGWTINLAYAYTDADFDKVVDVDNTYGLGVGADISDYWLMSLTPEHAYTLSTEYRVKMADMGALVFLLSYDWRDEQAQQSATIYKDSITGYAKQNKHVVIDSYGVSNARISWDGIPLTNQLSAVFSVWAKNLTDEDYVAYQFTGFTQGPVGYFGSPRTLGADFTLKF